MKTTLSGIFIGTALVVAWLLGLWVLTMLPAEAWLQSRDSNYNKSISAGASYTGPGDIVSGATAFYSLRAYSAAYAASGGLAVNLRNASTNETCDFPVVSTGGLGVANNCSVSSNGLSLSTFCTLGCASPEWYDQTANAENALQSTAAKQPTLTLSCNNSLSCLVNVSGGGFVTGTITALSQPVTYSAVFERTSATPGYGVIVADDGGSGTNLDLEGNSTTANSMLFFAGSTVVFSETDNAWHSVQTTIQTTTSAYNVDGTDSTGHSAGSNSGATARGVFTNNQLTNNFTGKISEVGVWHVAFTSTQRGNMCHNQYGYWGTSTSC